MCYADLMGDGHNRLVVATGAGARPEAPPKRMEALLRHCVLRKGAIFSVTCNGRRWAVPCALGRVQPAGLLASKAEPDLVR